MIRQVYNSEKVNDPFRQTVISPPRMLRLRRMAISQGPPKPTPQTRDALKKPKGMTRKGFGELIKRALNPSASKPVSKP
jgi:hypothetical protein